MKWVFDFKRQCTINEAYLHDLVAQIEIEDMEFDEDQQVYTYPCPCGDKFTISIVRK